MSIGEGRVASHSLDGGGAPPAGDTETEASRSQRNGSLLAGFIQRRSTIASPRRHLLPLKRPSGSRFSSTCLITPEIALRMKTPPTARPALRPRRAQTHPPYRVDLVYAPFAMDAEATRPESEAGCSARSHAFSPRAPVTTAPGSRRGDCGSVNESTVSRVAAEARTASRMAFASSEPGEGARLRHPRCACRSENRARSAVIARSSGVVNRKHCNAMRQRFSDRSARRHRRCRGQPRARNSGSGGDARHDRPIKSGSVCIRKARRVRLMVPAAILRG